MTNYASPRCCEFCGEAMFEKLHQCRLYGVAVFTCSQCGNKTDWVGFEELFKVGFCQVCSQKVSDNG